MPNVHHCNATDAIVVDEMILDICSSIRFRIRLKILDLQVPSHV